MSKAVVRPLIIAGVIAGILLAVLHLLNETDGRLNCATWAEGFWAAKCASWEIGAAILVVVILVIGAGLYVANERRPSAPS